MLVKAKACEDAATTNGPKQLVGHHIPQKSAYPILTTTGKKKQNKARLEMIPAAKKKSEWKYQKL